MTRVAVRAPVAGAPDVVADGEAAVDASDVAARAPHVVSTASTRWIAWREAAKVFVVSRLIIIFISFIAATELGGGTQALLSPTDPRWYSWYHFDTILFTGIAFGGYNTHNTAFFPLWPLLVHVVGSPFGVSLATFYWTGLALSNLCFLLALVLLYRLLARDFAADVARRAILYLAFYPYALFFFAPYTESLFLLLCLGVFLCLRRDDMWSWWLAGVLGLLAALTRLTGLVLVLPFLAFAWQRGWATSAPPRRRLWLTVRAAAPSVLVPAGVGIYMLYLGVTKGNPLLFQQVEAQGWGRHTAWPWEGLIGAVRDTIGATVPVLNLLDLIFVLGPLLILALGWKRIPVHYRLFAAGVALLSLCAPLHDPEPLSSAPRYLMVAFPIVAICALWGRFPRFDRFYMAAAPAILALNVVLFSTHHWVA